MAKKEMKKVKALIDCTGAGYENFKKDEIRNIETEKADILIMYGYAEAVKTVRTANDGEKSEAV